MANESGTEVVDPGTQEGAEGQEQLDGDVQAGGEGAAAAAGGAERPRAPNGQFTRIRFKYTGKGGKEEVFEGTEEELGKQFSLPSEAYRRLNEANKLREEAERQRTEAETREKAILGDPKAFRQWVRDTAKKHGISEDSAFKHLVMVMKGEITDRSRDPKEKELEELRQLKQEREAADKKAADDAEKKRITEEQQAAIAKHRPVFVAKLEKVLAAGKLPKNDIALGIAAEAMLDGQKAGLDDEGLAAFTRDEVVGFATDLTTGWTGEDVEKNLPHVFRAVHQTLTKRIRERRAGATGNTPREAPAVRRPTEASHEGSGRRPPPKIMTRAEEKRIYGG